MPAGKSAIIYDHYEYEWEKRLVAFFLFFGTLLGVGSFISDVFNYLEFSTYESDHESGLIGLDDMTATFFTFVIVAGIIYGLEVIFMLVAFGGRWHRQSNGRQAIMWTREVMSIVDSILCDLSFLVLYFLSFAVGFCPMLQQMRTVRGKVAVTLTAAHAVFAIVQSIYYRKVVGRYPSNCERLLKKFCWMLHVLIAACAVFSLVAAYINDPIHTSMTRKQFRQWGFGESQSAPIYFVQDLNVADVINKQFNATGVDLHKGNTTSHAFDNRLAKLLKCKNIRTAFYLSDLDAIMESEDGVLKAFNCSDVVPVFRHILEDEHKLYARQSNCTILAKVKYDFQTSLITYSLGYELRPLNKVDECYSGYFDTSEPETATGSQYEIPVSPASASDVNKVVLGDTCSQTGCYRNDTRLIENLFSCLDRNCTRYNISDEATYVFANPFRLAWNSHTVSYQSDLKSLRSLVQCNVRIKTDARDLELCHNTTFKFSRGQKITQRCI